MIHGDTAAAYTHLHPQSAIFGRVSHWEGREELRAIQRHRQVEGGALEGPSGNGTRPDLELSILPREKARRRAGRSSF